MRGGDYRLEVKIIQKFENKKNRKKKFQKNIIKFPLVQPGLKVELQAASTWTAFSLGSCKNRD